MIVIPNFLKKYNTVGLVLAIVFFSIFILKWLWDKVKGPLPWLVDSLTPAAVSKKSGLDLYEAAYSLIGSGMHNIGWGNEGTGEPLIFDPPLVFESGVELGVYGVMVAFGTTPTWGSGHADLAAILKIEKV